MPVASGGRSLLCSSRDCRPLIGFQARNKCRIKSKLTYMTSKPQSDRYMASVFVCLTRWRVSTRFQLVWIIWKFLSWWPLPIIFDSIHSNWGRCCVYIYRRIASMRTFLKNAGVYILHLHLLLLQELTTAFIVSLIFLLCLPPSTYSVQQTKRKEKRRRPLCFFLSLSPIWKSINPKG